MWWFKPKQKKQVGIEVTAQAMTDQICNWLDIPPQQAPEIVVFEGAEKQSKYFPKTHTIHIFSPGPVRDGLLAHEIAHAVVQKYGKVSPRMHEILAGYAEFKVTKVFKA